MNCVVPVAHPRVPCEKLYEGGCCMIEKVRLAEKFAQFSDTWSPKIVGEVNDAHVKLVKLKGEFVWHNHEQEDELFLVISGHLVMKLRERHPPGCRRICDH